jgi:hypothetical protein
VQYVCKKLSIGSRETKCEISACQERLVGESDEPAEKKEVWKDIRSSMLWRKIASIERLR